MVREKKHLSIEEIRPILYKHVGTYSDVEGLAQSLDRYTFKKMEELIKAIHIIKKGK